MDEVLETEEILADKQLMKSIRLSRQDSKAGRTIEWDKVKLELKSKGKL